MMMEDYRRRDERALIAGAQNGALSAAGQLVALHQSELVRTAYLLTDSHAQALILSEEAFKRAFAGISRSDPESPFRPVLLDHLARLFLNPPARLTADDAGWSEGASGGRYQVENARTRCRQELGLIEPPMRAAIVLYEFNELDFDTISRATGQPSDRLPGALERTRDRLTDRLSLTGPRAVRVALNEAAIDAPRRDLWVELEDEVAHILQEQQRRSRILTVAVAAIVALVLVGGLTALVAGAILDGGPEDPASGGTGSGPIAPAEPGTAQAIDLIEPTPTEVVYEPAGDVPDRLHGTRFELVADTLQTESVLLDFETDEFGEPLEGMLTTISPDGRTGIALNQQLDGEETYWIVAAIDLATGEVRWNQELGPVDLSGQSFPLIDAIVHREQVVVAYDPGFQSDLVNVARLDLEDGSIVREEGLELNQPHPEIHLFARPDQGDVMVVARSQQTREVTTHRLAGAGSDGGGLHVESGEEVVLDFGLAIPAPDGRGIAIPPITTSQTEEPIATRFLTFDSLAVAEVELPFAIDEDARLAAIQNVLSHDGERLYVINTYSQEIAVVDLRRRILERMIPLDLGSFAPSQSPLFGLMPSMALYNPGSATLSNDGRHLYMIAPPHEGEGTLATSIWKIETATWRVIGHWMRDYPAPISTLHLTGDGSRLLAFTALSGAGRDSDQRLGHLYEIDTESGEIVQTIEGAHPDMFFNGTLADLYRSIYGQSPAVAGTAPELITDFTSLPRIEVEAEPEQVDPGGSVQLQVRLLDPGDPFGDRLITPGTDRVRFDQNATVTATVDSGNDRQLVVLGQVEYGVYSASVVLNEPASWDVIIDVAPGDGEPWSVQIEGAVDTRATFTGSDGRDYQVKLAAVRPDLPLVGQPSEVLFHIADAESGARLPDGVTFPGVLPTRLSARMETTTPFSFYRSGRGAYSGIFIFPEAGVHYIQIDGFQQLGVDSPIYVGPIEVRPA